MAIEITSANNLAKTKGIKCLVYGESGLGKTMLAATAKNCVVISIEPGTLSLVSENIKRVFGEDKGDINYNPAIIQAQTLGQAEEALGWALSKEAEAYDTIVIDSLTEYGRLLLSDATERLKDGRQIYGDVQTKLLDMLYTIKHSEGKNFVIIAHARWYDATDNDVEICGPALPGKQLGRSSPHEFDEVFQIAQAKNKEGKLKRYLKTEKDDYGYAKDRSGALNKKERPHLDNIFKKILGE